MAVEFPEEKQQPVRRTMSTRGGRRGMTALLVRSGWARDERNARLALVGVAVACFAAALAVYAFVNPRMSDPVPPPNLVPSPYFR